MSYYDILDDYRYRETFSIFDRMEFRERDQDHRRIQHDHPRRVPSHRRRKPAQPPAERSEHESPLPRPIKTEQELIALLIRMAKMRDPIRLRNIAEGKFPA